MVLKARWLAQQLYSLSPEHKIVCIHPNIQTQNVILNVFEQQSLYVRFNGHNLDGDRVEAMFQAASQQQVETAPLDGALKYIVFDEVDRVQPAVLVALLRRILAEFTDTRIILLSRLVIGLLLEDEQLRALTTFIPDDPQQMLLDYTRVESELLLEVRAFGDGRVHLNGRRVETWDGALPRALFFYLVDRGMVTRAEIFKTFWPNLSTREATNVFHVTKRKISEVLQTELTVYGSSFYHISPRIQVSYDVSLFNQSLLESDSASNGDALRQAISLYRGDYLTSISSDWVQKRRESLQQAACDALVSLGKLCEANGSVQEALGFYLRASRLRPEREDSAFASMRLYRDLDLRDDALQVYHALESTLRRSLNVMPSPQIQQLAGQIAR